MLKTMVLFLALIGLAACGLANYRTADFETDRVREVALQSYKAVVSVEGIMGHGTGVAIARTDKYTYILTNYHVVNPALPGDVLGFYCHQGKYHSAVLVRADDKADVALLRTESKIGTIPFASMDESFGDFARVYAVGYPLSAGLTITEGRIMPNTGKYKFDIAHTAMIAPGNSGGPLLAYDPVDKRIEVIGLNAAVGASQYGMATHIALAISHTTIYKVLFKDIPDK